MSDSAKIIGNADSKQPGKPIFKHFEQINTDFEQHILDVQLPFGTCVLQNSGIRYIVEYKIKNMMLTNFSKNRKQWAPKIAIFLRSTRGSDEPRVLIKKT